MTEDEDEDDDDTGIHQNNIMRDLDQCCKSGFFYIRAISQIWPSRYFMSTVDNMRYDIHFNYYFILFPLSLLLIIF